MYFNHGVATDSVAHLPLIIRWPGVTDGGSRHGSLIYQYDFMATVMELLGIERPGMWEARSLAPLLNGASDHHRPYLVFGCGIFAQQRAVRTDRHIHIRTFHPGCHPLKSRYLFDVRTDPYEQFDLSDSEPGVMSEMEQRYSRWWEQWCAGPDAVLDPMHIQTPTFEYFSEQAMMDRLEFLDREDQMDHFRRQFRRVRRQSQTTPCPDSRF
jgi:arylsulfatase A-like enzyme